MDFKPGMIQSFMGNAPLPFYMTYPGFLQQEQDSTVLRDLEYLQQTYPGEVRRYQNRIAEILDKMDYEGSMIYDEYPDRDSIVRLTRTMVDIIRREEEAQAAQEGTDTSCEDVAASDEDTVMTQRRICAPGRWNGRENLIQVLLCNEIYKRRRGGRRGFLKF